MIACVLHQLRQEATRRPIEELESTYVAPSPKPAMAERGKASADERAGKENSQP